MKTTHVSAFQPYSDIEEVRQLLQKEILEKGTSAATAVSSDGWEAYIFERNLYYT